MSVVALIVHEMRADAELHARGLASWLRSRGHQLVILDQNVNEFAGRDGPLDLDVQVREPEDLAAGAELVISLGGDGSMLRAVDLAAPHGVAVLGVNFGQLGYLTEVEPQNMTVAVEAALAGTAKVEERMRVAVTVVRAGGAEEFAGHALNEALIERGVTGHTVRLGLTIDDEFFLSYAADGIIVATPTGSTAYSMSARGPIVAPQHQAFVVTAVSPHQLFDRSLVLRPDSSVQVDVLPGRGASLSLDGRPAIDLAPGDRVICRESPIPGLVVSTRTAPFLTVLKTKFGLEDR
ncbi:MAG: NAD(+)/NADH kinase [Actinomycetota bacterium]